jgi:hypothetical protein
VPRARKYCRAARLGQREALQDPPGTMEIGDSGLFSPPGGFLKSQRGEMGGFDHLLPGTAWGGGGHGPFLQPELVLESLQHKLVYQQALCVLSSSVWPIAF